LKARFSLKIYFREGLISVQNLFSRRLDFRAKFIFAKARFSLKIYFATAKIKMTLFLGMRPDHFSLL